MPSVIISHLLPDISQELPSANRRYDFSPLIRKLLRWLRITLVIAAVIITISIGGIAWLWQERSDLSELGWPLATATPDSGEAVTVTWLGVSTLLFDDNDTQILIDGFFTRLGIADYLFRRVATDIANVNYAMAEYRINRLAAIIPVHSHFDHAMDAGIVANRSSAIVLGSESTANIVRGAKLPVDQYQILADGETRQFGDFTITLIHSVHAPNADGNKAWFPGNIEEPLRQPARVNEWREGQTYSVLISHPRGTTLVQGSAGFVENGLQSMSADVVMLGVAGLSGLGQQYTKRYWHEIVTQTGASRVYPVHFDDFSKPFGDVVLFPKIADDVVKTSGWINALASSTEVPTDIRRLPFGIPIVLY